MTCRTRARQTYGNTCIVNYTSSINSTLDNKIRILSRKGFSGDPEFVQHSYYITGALTDTKKLFPMVQQFSHDSE